MSIGDALPVAGKISGVMNASTLPVFLRFSFFGVAVAVLLAGCAGKPAIDPLADSVDPTLLVSAQGHLTPGVVVYEEDGGKLGTIIKVDPDYVYPNGTRGGVLMDWAEKGKSDSYYPLSMMSANLVIPSDAKTAS